MWIKNCSCAWWKQKLESILFAACRKIVNIISSWRIGHCTGEYCAYTTAASTLAGGNRVVPEGNPPKYQ